MIDVQHTALSDLEAGLDLIRRSPKDALQFVSTPIGKQLKLRGIYTKVVQPGVIRVGDVVRKLEV